jgi:hypothetical protein
LAIQKIGLMQQDYGTHRISDFQADWRPLKVARDMAVKRVKIGRSALTQSSNFRHEKTQSENRV